MTGEGVNELLDCAGQEIVRRTEERAKEQQAMKRPQNVRRKLVKLKKMRV